MPNGLDQLHRQLRLGAKSRVIGFAREVMRGRVGPQLQREIGLRRVLQHVYRDDARVDFAQAAQILPPDVGGVGSVLPVTRLIDDQNSVC